MIWRLTGAVILDAWIPAVEVVQGNPVLGGKIVASIARNHLVEPFAICVNTRLDRGRHARRRSRLGGGGGGHSKADNACADVVVQPQTCALDANGRVPGHQVGKRDSAVLLGESLAGVAALDNVPPVTVGSRTRLGGARSRDSTGNGCRRWSGRSRYGSSRLPTLD